MELDTVGVVVQFGDFIVDGVTRFFGVCFGGVRHWLFWFLS